jgi:4-nitrophenyl phosphatase
VGAVLVGFDIDLNYRKLAQATTHLRYNEGCLFYATNTDATYPLNGRLFPGTGTMVRAIETAVGRKPDLVFGKPNQLLLRCIEEKFHLQPERTCMVGDRLDTDIAFGKAGGLRTLLVLSGVTQSADLEGLSADKQPDYCLPDLSHLLK